MPSDWGAVISVAITMVTHSFVGTHPLVFRDLNEKKGREKMGNLGFQSGEFPLYFIRYDNAKGKGLRTAAPDSTPH